MSARTMFLTSTTAAAVVLTLATLAGCGGQPAASGGLSVANAWARTSPAVADAGAAYMDIRNTSSVDDALVGVTVDSAVAMGAELHETVAVGTAMGGEMEMRPVQRIVIGAGATVQLKPGGFHVMLMDLAQPLTTGGTVRLTLDFERAPDIVVTAEIRETAP